MNKKKLKVNLVQHLRLDLNQERIDQVLLLSIGYLWKQLDHKKVFKNEFMEDMKWCVIEDDSWRRINNDLATIIIHQRRASGSFGIKKLDVMEKWKWMFNPRNQINHEESHITKCQSLLNQDLKWHGDQKWKLIVWCEVLQVTTSPSQCQSKIKYVNPNEAKEKWSVKNQYCVSSSWRIVFYI
jgi:hypothetical protein